MNNINIKNSFYALCILIVMSSLSSCNTCKSFGESALGNKFALVEADKNNKSILYCTSPKCCYAGITIVPTNVVSYNRNSKWIVAKSENKLGFNYWIIDKGFTIEFKYDSGMREEIMSHVIGPLDSTAFKKELENRQIKLSLD
jgi:predicted small secreted protein